MQVVGTTRRMVSSGGTSSPEGCGEAQFMKVRRHYAAAPPHQLTVPQPPGFGNSGERHRLPEY